MGNDGKPYPIRTVEIIYIDCLNRFEPIGPSTNSTRVIIIFNFVSSDADSNDFDRFVSNSSIDYGALNYKLIKRFVV